MRHLPVKVTSVIGAFLGRRKMVNAYKKNLKWVARFERNIEELSGIKTADEKYQKLLEFGEEFGRLYAETTVLQKMDKENRITINGLQKLTNKATPKIFIAPHLSNWELVCKVFTTLENKTYALYEPRENQQRMQIVNSARQAWGENISLISTAEPMAMKNLKQALIKGDNLFILPDEEINGLVMAPSLGRNIPYAGNRWMVSRLAVSHQVDVVPVSVKRLEANRFEVEIHDVISPDLSLDSKMAAQKISDEIDQLFNRLILAKPQSWYWLPYLRLDSTSKN